MTPKKLSINDWLQVRQWIKEGKTQRWIAEQYGCHKNTLFSYVAKHKLENLTKPKVQKIEMKYKLQANTIDEKIEYRNKITKSIDKLLKDCRHIQIHTFSENYPESDNFKSLIYVLPNGVDLTLQKSMFFSIFTQSAESLGLVFKA